MKRFLLALSLAVCVVLSSTAVFAEHYWNDSMKFTAAYGSVTIDGVIGAGEWDDAQAIVVTMDHPYVAEDKMVFQGDWDGFDSAGPYTYKIKWDEDYIYFLEDRDDAHVSLFGDGEMPWLTDGSLIFTQIDSPDGSMNPEGVSVHIFYSVGNGRDAIGGDLRARICNMEEGSRETIEVPGGKIVTALRANGFIAEVAVPWSLYKTYVPNFTGPQAGMLMGLSYVIDDSSTDDVAFEKQILFPIDNANIGDVPGGYDFGGWGVLELLAAPVVAEPDPEPVADEPAAGGEEIAQTEPLPAPAPQPTPTAPATGDSGVAITLALALLVAGMVAAARRRSAKN